VRARVRARRQNGERELSVVEASGLVSGIAGFGLQTLLLLLAPIYAIGLLTGYGQIGFALTTKALAIDPAKLSPMRGWQKIFSVRGAVRTAFAIAKILLISAAMGAAAWAQRENMARLSALELGPALAGIGTSSCAASRPASPSCSRSRCSTSCSSAGSTRRDLRMTKQEVREELKHTEGDPHVKARIRRVQREIARAA
jgi:flagellar biosynthetic protein FlhB